ncbi:serine hydrolase domain-containing protein [Kitasatospora kazusensis]|uniref:Serine hydrolase domain-containing protein n=1 Tax=Kitasatospora kazusensis TaxID=407974 RepID=A0ABN2ZAD9_9ACTN
MPETTPPVIRGFVRPGFEPVATAFADNIRTHGDRGAAVCVYQHGVPVVDLATDDLPVGRVQLVRSVSKGVLTILAHLLAQEGVLDLDAPVAELWPEFGRAGKGAISTRLVLSHRAGLSAVDRTLTLDDVLIRDPAVAALADQRPQWTPGTAHGYHDLTFGWLIGEILRRATGLPVGELVRKRLADPLGLDLWLGLPASELPRLAPLVPAQPTDTDSYLDSLAGQLADPTSLTHRSYLNPDVSPIEHDPAYLAAEVPSANGVSDARSLARLYAATVSEVDGLRLLAPETTASAATPQSEGTDIVAHRYARYASGFMLPYPMREMAGPETGCFGHYGRGGPLAFAVPEHALAFGYTTTRERLYPSSDPRSRGLAEAAVHAAQALTRR